MWHFRTLCTLDVLQVIFVLIDSFRTVSFNILNLGRRQPPPEHRPQNWPFPGEQPFSTSDVIFREPEIVWEANPFKSF